MIINETKAHPIEALSIDTISNEAFSIKSQKRKPKPYRLRYSNATFMRCKTAFIFVTLCIVFGIRTVSLTWAQIESAAIVDRYVVRLPFRRLVHADWMYIEVEPGVNFDNESDFDAAPQIILRLDLLFGDVPTP